MTDPALRHAAAADGHRSAIRVALSTSSVYPENTRAAFRYAEELGYDGVELMVWMETMSQDVRAVAALSRQHNVPVLSVHAPCLLLSQTVWGSDPVAKLARSVGAAEEFGADVVVVHPPFRWQRRYSAGFRDQVAELSQGGVKVAVENMFPVRLGKLWDTWAGRRLQNRTGAPESVSAFDPSPDPTDVGYDHYTLDLSHAATAQVDALDLADRMGEGLAHVHLGDGTGSPVDEHLLPGKGNQPCAELCRRLARSGFSGHVVLEVSTKAAQDRDERKAMLAEALAFAREHLARPGRRPAKSAELVKNAVEPEDGEQL
ncbi:MAG: sugar phosphate isomerase/epimerase family protein [Segniliparus sp.]|uniref:sugar phosphate isomerase/epimerase family protein n=1 Tax=Segniliparus sp. TaxID=2804064 RepID=UPI003F3841C2